MGMLKSTFIAQQSYVANKGEFFFFFFFFFWKSESLVYMRKKQELSQGV
jgi:hypothetical protein